MVKRCIRPVVVFLSLLFACAEGYAQGFGIHLDKKMYIAGDALRYQIYYLDPLDKNPGLLYVCLFNSRRLTLDKQLLKLDSLGAEGCIYLPSDLETGRYILHFYLVWDSQTGSEPKFDSGSIPVDIYNDFDEEISDLGQPGLVFPVAGQEIYARIKSRSRVQLVLTIDSSNTDQSFQNGSVSIFQYLPGLTDPNRSLQHNRSSDINTNSYELRSQPVLEGLLVDPVRNIPVSEKYLSLFVPGLGSFQRFTADSGKFRLKLPTFTGVQAVQALSLNPNHSRPMEIRPLDFSPAPPEILFEGAPIQGPYIQAYLQLHYKRRIVNDFYKLSEEKPGPQENSFKTLIPDRVYNLKDFQQINTVGDFIREVMLDTRASTVMDDRNKLRLRSKDNQDLFRWPAWIMVDGLFAGKESAVFQQEIGKVSAIGIFQKEATILSQLDTMMKYSGLFAIQGSQLKDHAAEYGCLALPVQGWTSGSTWSFNPPLDTNRPDLRSMLYWNAKVKADDTGKMVLGFYTSDLTGLFEIKLSGYDRLRRFVSRTFLIEIE